MSSSKESISPQHGRQSHPTWLLIIAMMLTPSPTTGTTICGEPELWIYTLKDPLDDFKRWII